ncbi:MAG TPA: hypothetical protein VGG39_25460 [Polyangiaceae bacterium]|jgi:hypothetical protein
MKRTLPLLAGLVAASAVTFAMTREAHALGPVDLEVGALAGVGTTPSNLPAGAVNPLGFGLGARGGVDVFGFYGGVKLMYYFGGSSGGFSDHSLSEGVDLGYNIKLAILTLRPMVGLGNFTITESAGGASTNTGTFYVEPGVTALVSLGLIYVGADVNALLLTSLPQPTGGNGMDTALTIHGQVGLKF